jgi:hypothetical protein
MLGFIVDVYFITQIYKKTNNNKNVLIIILCLITGIILFSLSKYFKHYKKNDSNIIKYHKIGDSLHSATHLIVTIGHILLIKEYNLLKQIT